MIAVSTATTDAQLRQILELQHRYHAKTVSPEVAAAEGFVFAEHTLPLLRKMSALSPQAIGELDGRVVGYCLSLPSSLKTEVPALVPMFEQFERTLYRGQPLLAKRVIVGGQVCVDRPQRGQGLLRRLYEQLRDASDAEVCVTEIAVRNVVSLRAHEKMGFETIATYRDASDEWAIVAWDLGAR